MKDNLQVISLDSQKVWYEIINNTKIVNKKTSHQEKDNLLKAKNFLKNKYIKINNIHYSIQVPNIYAWNKNTNILSMSYCQGENLELLLRNPHTRQRAIHFLQSTMRFILAQHFYWQDYAPRNIIIDDETIYLIDFVKGLFE